MSSLTSRRLGEFCPPCVRRVRTSGWRRRNVYRTLTCDGRDRRRRNWRGLTLLVCPHRESQCDHQQQRGKQPPGNLSRTRTRLRLKRARFTHAPFMCRNSGAGLGFRRRVGRCAFARGLEVIDDRLVLVDPHAARIGADESLIEDPARKLAELIVLQRVEHARADLGSERDLVQCDRSLLSFRFQLLAKGRQSSLPSTACNSACDVARTLLSARAILSLLSDSILCLNFTLKPRLIIEVSKSPVRVGTKRFCIRPQTRGLREY